MTKGRTPMMMMDVGMMLKYGIDRQEDGEEGGS
jgi:hypothetical protein